MKPKSAVQKPTAIQAVRTPKSSTVAPLSQGFPGEGKAPAMLMLAKPAGTRTRMPSRLRRIHALRCQWEKRTVRYGTSRSYPSGAGSNRLLRIGGFLKAISETWA